MKRRTVRSEPLFFERNPDRFRRPGHLLPALDVPEIDPQQAVQAVQLQRFQRPVEIFGVWFLRFGMSEIGSDVL